MKSNRLKLNSDKTQFLWLGSRQQLAKIDTKTTTIGEHFIESLTPAKNLCVTFNSKLGMTCMSTTSLEAVSISWGSWDPSDDHSPWMPRKHWSIPSYQVVSTTATVFFTVPQTSSWEDCNPSSTRQPGWSRTKGSSTISLLYWGISSIGFPSVSISISRVKITVFVHNTLHGRDPTYLSRNCNPVREVGARAHLRSAVRGDLTVPRTKTRRFGPRSFRVSGPVVWNSLPEDIWIPEMSLERFKSILKTHLFRLAYA